MADRPRPSIHALLEHARFVRALARAILTDSAHADDAAQETWIAALQSRLPPGAEVRAWLGKIVRSRSLNLARTERRRSARERAAAVPRSVPAAHEIVERESVRREVVNAVLALPEPQRTIVLLRYYEGHTSREIGNLLQRSPSTVRGQLRSGLAMLRTSLDAQHGGDRRAWATPLAALARLPGGAGVPAAFAGLLARCALVAAALTLAAFVVTRWPGWNAGEAGAVDTERARAHDRLDGSRAQPAEDATASAERLALATPLLPRAPEQRSVLSWQGRLLARETLLPIGGAVVEIVSGAGYVTDDLAFVDDRGIRRHAITDAQGMFHFDGLPAGPYAVLCHGADLSLRTLVTLFAPGDGPSVLYLDPTPPAERALVVHAIDREGRGVAGAQVTVVGADPWGDWVGARGREPWQGETGEDGRWTIAHAQPRSLGSRMITVRAPDGRTGRSRLDDGRTVIGPPAAIAGRLLLPPGASTAGWTLAALACVGDRSGGALLDVPDLRHDAILDGARFAIEGVPAGDVYWLVLKSPTGHRLADGPALTQVAAGQTTWIDLRVEAGTQLRGRVVDGRGRPVEAAHVVARQDDGQTRHALEIALHRTDADAIALPRTQTDRDGRYLLTGLAPGPWIVEITGPGFARHRAPATAVANRDPDEVVHRLEEAGVLQGIALPGSALALRRSSDEEILASWYAETGPFTIPGLPTGELELACLDHNSNALFVLRTIRIEAGRTTCADLRADSPFSIEGMVVDDAGPVAGITICAGHPRPAPTATTGPDGRFVLLVPGPNRTELWGELEGLAILYRRVPAADGPGVRRLGIWKIDAHPVVVRTLDAHGQPISCAVAIGAGSLIMPPPVHRARTDEAGELRLPYVRHANLGMQAYFPDGFVASASFETGAVPAEIVLRAAPSGTVRVRLEDPSGTPVCGRTVEIGICDEDTAPPTDAPAFYFACSSFRASARTDENGIALFRGVPAGAVLAHHNEFPGTVGGDRFREPALREHGLPPLARAEVRAGETIEVIVRVRE